MANNSYPPQYQPDPRLHARPAAQEHDMTMYGSGSGHRRGPSFSSQPRGTSGADETSMDECWMPAYLEKTRYAKKLRDAQDARKRNLRDQDVSNTGLIGSIWNRPSNARIAPSHRGMTYDIIESNPPHEDDITPLPSRLSATDKSQGLDISSDGLEVRYNGVTGKVDLEAASVRSDYPMSPQVGIYYYEITIRQKSKDCAVAVGFSSAKSSLERLPGWEPESWAYHGDDGKAFYGSQQGQTYSQTFGQGDTIGCGIDFNKGQSFFTKNGTELGPAFKELDLPSTPIFPCISMKKYNGTLIAINFGRHPFVFDMRKRMEEETGFVNQLIEKTKTNKLHPDHATEYAFTQELVAQFLSHGGYIETAKEFSQQVQEQQKALHNQQQSSSPVLQNPETPDARPRQQIRQAILKGDIDLALASTQEYFPNVLPEFPQILFQLKCRKFLELVLKAAELDKSRSPIMKHRQSTNGEGSHSSAVDDVFDQAMELDDEQQSSLNGNGKTPIESNVSNNAEYNQITAEALQYGRGLREEYADQTVEQDKMLHDIFSLMPYYDPKPSQNGHLLDPDGRTKVAEDLNSAILSMSPFHY